MREMERWAENDRILSFPLPGAAVPTKGFHQGTNYRSLWKVLNGTEFRGQNKSGCHAQVPKAGGKLSLCLPLCTCNQVLRKN